MIIRILNWPDDYDALMDHVQMVHGEDDLQYVSLWYGSTPAFDPHDCYVVEDDETGEIVGHAMINPRQIQIGNSVLPAAEIAIVGVQEPYRRQGFAHRLLDVLHERMDQRGDALGLIFGIPNFYESWLYEYAVGLYLTSYESQIATEDALRAGQWDHSHSYERRTADFLGARNRHVMVRRFYASDLPAVANLYARESTAGHYLIARDEATWNWQLDYQNRIDRQRLDDFLVAEVDGRLEAYVRVVSEAEVNWFRDDASRFSVIEAAGSQPDAIEALLEQVGKLAQAHGETEIGLYVHPEGAFMRHAIARGGRMCASTGAGFLRLHDLQLTLDLMRPTLEERRMNSRYVSRAYHLAVTTEHAYGEVILGMGDSELVEVEIPSTSLVRLLTGWYSVDHLDNGFNERYQDLLQVLFPKRDPKIGLADLM